MKAKSGGGITMNKNVSPPVKTGSPRRGSSPAAAAQIGASTAFRKDEVDAGRGYNSGVMLGNQKSLDVGAGGVGTGRTVHKSGSQSLHGTPAPGKADAVRGFDVRGRGKDVV